MRERSDRSVLANRPIGRSDVLLRTDVYDHAHIGNLRTYVFEDILRRTLELFGYTVKHAMNITDVGHLQSDARRG